MEHALAAPTFTAWRHALKGRRLTVGDAFIVAMVLYVVVILFMRFFWAFWPWTMEGDWKQWIWQYHRYYTDGAFPPGHIITDYQFRVQPPFYWLVMSALSHVVHPGVAARVLAVVAWSLALLGTYRATTRLSHWVMGLAAVVFLSHDFHIFMSTTGGYPRSFGIALVVLILDAWIARRHAVVLALLVVTAGLYPSVLPPCGLAYGVATLWSALRARDWRGLVGRGASLVVAAALCGALAMSQNLLALEWWGPVISLEDAEKLTALHAGGRMRWLPHGDYWQVASYWVTQPFETSGALAHYKLAPWPDEVPRFAGALVTLALVILVAVRRRAGDVVRLPWEPVMLIGCALVVYAVARELAFRLYLPVRVMQHVAPVCVIVFVPALAYRACKVWPRTRDHGVRALKAALAFTLLPVFLLGGDGFLLPGWGDYSHRREQLSWIEENTPVNAQFAGDIATCDLIPYFTARPVYVNWTMAHPFRLGYWQEIERRLRRVHDVMYAHEPHVVLEFLDEEKVDYLVIDRARFVEPDTGRKLFHPIRDDVIALWEKRKKQGFILASPPPSAIVWQGRGNMVLDARRLREAWASP